MNFFPIGTFQPLFPKRFRVLRYLCTSIFVFTSSAFAGPHAELIERSSSESSGAIQIKEGKISITDFGTVQGKKRPAALIEGKLSDPESSLILNQARRARVSAEGEFKVLLPLDSEITPVEFVSVDARGKIARHQMEIRFPEFHEYIESIRAPGGDGKWLATVGIGVSRNSYVDTRISEFNQTALTPKFAVSRALSFFPSGKRRWDVGVSGYFTGVQLARSSDHDVRFFGLNLRSGYTPEGIAEPWTFQIQGGVYFASMLVSPADFGYQNILGPQLFPTLRRSLSANRSVSAYFKYSPILNQAEFLSLSNREIAAGLAHSWILKTGHALSVTADVSHLQIYFDQIRATSRSVTLGLSYSL